MHFRVMTVVATIVLIAGAAEAQQERVLLSNAANREVWRGETSGSQAALYLDRGDLNAGDDRRDLIVGAPAFNSNTGRVYVVYSGPLRTGEFRLNTAGTII